ncbi:hypothetical protein PMAYCL1PPCAC_23482 [Pristionchus mayeri]|uniref:Nop domain-containing protein n=1 Tax=Pristionchus mayeri TaxID=1317129 RepID=A0AAN5D0A5_9BILA|nr:hypothetical protein PMAYCL1PPCAC_23482 [Pristionchus mayeri]
MLILYETPAGYAVFKMTDEKKLKDVDNIYEHFSTASKAQSALELVSFKKFKTTAEAVEGATAIADGKLNKTLKKLLKSKVDASEKLAVGDAKLGALIKDQLELSCVNNAGVNELMRGIRLHIDSLLGEHKAELSAMNLALAHSLGRYKVKFNPEKIDTMIVQAVSLLDDLDKELNNYAMRLREWYGWHFPEIGKIVPDHQAFAKTVKLIGMRQKAISTDLSGVLPEELETRVKEEAEMSMGTDISPIDLIHIEELCDQVIELTQYRAQLSDYLKNRMSALAPNLTVLLGELVGARLISHAGSLVNLAKYPASTVQILGAEKALFRALKSKKDTPKYGLIYHAALVGQAPPKLKGKMARKLAAKVSLSTRIDALADDSQGATVGLESRALLEDQLRNEEERGPKRISGVGHKQDKYQFKSETFEYDDSADGVKKGKKHRLDDNDDEELPKKAKKIKLEEDAEEDTETPKKKEKKKKVKKEAQEDDEE